MTKKVTKKQSTKTRRKPRVKKTWAHVLDDWSAGKCVKYPSSVKTPFFYETSPITKNCESDPYCVKFVKTNDFDGVTQDYSRFADHIKNSTSKYVLCFFNLTKTSMLVVPMPKRGKQFTTIKDFIDEASPTQQKLFWKKVRTEVKKMLKVHDKIWVSTHGTGVPFFHLRLDTNPKYYVTQKFKDM